MTQEISCGTYHSVIDLYKLIEIAVPIIVLVTLWALAMNFVIDIVNYKYTIDNEDCTEDECYENLG